MEMLDTRGSYYTSIDNQILREMIDTYNKEFGLTLCVYTFNVIVNLRISL